MKDVNVESKRCDRQGRIIARRNEENKHKREINLNH